MFHSAALALLMVALAPPAYAAQSSGGAGGGTNFACDTSTCICNGTYTDCKSMEDKCSGKISCPSGATYCSCTKKASVRQKQLPKSNVAPGDTLKIAPQ